MPPNYGIVDHVAFYHSDVVEGPLPQAIGEVVDCEAIPNVDGGKYEWRLIKVTLSRSGRVRTISLYLDAIFFNVLLALLPALFWKHCACWAGRESTQF